MSDKAKNTETDQAQEATPNASNPNHTTAAHFSIFKEECAYWIKKLGLLGYKVFYLHKDRDRDESGKNKSFANYNANVIGRNAVLCLSVNWDDEGLQKQSNGSSTITERGIRQSAFHEVWELLLHRLFHIAGNRAYTEFDFEEEKHNTIRIMENTVWREDREKWRWGMDCVQPVEMHGNQHVELSIDETLKRVKESGYEFSGMPDKEGIPLACDINGETGDYAETQFIPAVTVQAHRIAFAKPLQNVTAVYLDINGKFTGVEVTETTVAEDCKVTMGIADDVIEKMILKSEEDLLPASEERDGDNDYDYQIPWYQHPNPRISVMHGDVVEVRDKTAGKVLEGIIRVTPYSKKVFVQLV